jgi:hypothetical protein
MPLHGALLRRMAPDEIPLDLLAGYFRAWFHEPPWNEVYRCPRCNPPDDFGAAGRYGADAGARCPACGAGLEDYWTDERVDRYRHDIFDKPGFHGYVAEGPHGGIVGWTWTYDAHAVPELADVADGTIYVDTIGLLPEWRRLTAPLADYGLDDLAGNWGFERAITRTHVDARYVHVYMRRLGFRRLRASREEADREYWLIPIAGRPDHRPPPDEGER